MERHSGGGAGMEDNRDKLIPAQLAGWTWDLTAYAAKVPFYNADDLTMREVRNVFQLDPEPPQMELNDYIREAVRHPQVCCPLYRQGRLSGLCLGQRIIRFRVCFGGAATAFIHDPL